MAPPYSELWDPQLLLTYDFARPVSWVLFTGIGCHHRCLGVVYTPADILVWRSKWVPCFRTLDPDEAELFAQMTAPLPFTDMCTQLAQKLGEQAALERAGLLLARWADDGAVSIAP